MVPVVENLPDDATSLRNIILSLNTFCTEKEDRYKEHISILPVCMQRTGKEEQIRFLKAKLFGRKSEKLDIIPAGKEARGRTRVRKATPKKKGQENKNSL